jgi:hypothetical protein
MATVTLTAVSVWRPERGRTSLHRHDGPSTGRQFVRDVFEISPIEWGSIANLGWCTRL